MVDDGAVVVIDGIAADTGEYSGTTADNKNFFPRKKLGFHGSSKKMKAREALFVWPEDMEKLAIKVLILSGGGENVGMAFKEQGLVLAVLLGLLVFFSMAKTSITTLWSWRIIGHVSHRNQPLLYPTHYTLVLFEVAYMQPSSPAALVASEDFQHILRVLNTNVDGKQKIMFALTSIKSIGRRFANIVCKKADVDMTCCTCVVIYDEFRVTHGTCSLSFLLEVSVEEELILECDGCRRPCKFDVHKKCSIVRK
ncbi:hypothetical protein V8G54_011064 [Vigna mungo]|uniref:Uncharacterized protein n=1 Tax=Vigna mungo TaxID=3915 RepID=A0AAQ3NQR9_VIGMU